MCKLEERCPSIPDAFQRPSFFRTAMVRGGNLQISLVNRRLVQAVTVAVIVIKGGRSPPGSGTDRPHGRPFPAFAAQKSPRRAQQITFDIGLAALQTPLFS